MESSKKDLSAFLARLPLAIVFFSHGLSKVQNMDGTVRFFSKLGLPEPLAYVVAAIELLGGIAMLLGIGTRWAGLLLAAVMVGVLATAKRHAGLSGFELELTLLLVALSVAAGGPGSWSLTRLFRKGDAAPATPQV